MSIMTSIFMMCFCSTKLMFWMNRDRAPEDYYSWSDVIIIAILLEHLLIVVKFGLQVLIPDVPQWVKTLKRRGRQVKAEIKDEFGYLKISD
mmetsp:Transcript_99534/g.136784  ORF Transcript_99534/g.136784 Transcript_99534/m.136784 type:complete len:91 (+) Transcript_99534:898-1170(+)